MKARTLLLISGSLLLLGTLGSACSSGGEVDGPGGGDAGSSTGAQAASGGSESDGSGAESSAGAGVGGAGAGASAAGGTAGAVGSTGGADQGCGDLALQGESCAETADCCSGVCSPDGKCAMDVTACGEPGASCSNSTQCCTFSCVDGTCGTGSCTADGESCSVDAECCSQTCQDDGTCFKLNDLTDFTFPPEAKKENMSATCKTSGNPCADGGDCCSGLCGDGGTCERGSSFCVQAYDICSEDTDCCQGICAKAEGSVVGVCANRAGAGTRCDNMLVAGEVCDGDCSLCCSRSCAPFGEGGTFICQPPSGCRPEGELCTSDLDCCGGDPAFTHAGNQSGFCEIQADGLGRCSKTGCTPHGAICGYDDISQTSCNKNISAPQGTSCCQMAGAKQDLCAVDELLIPRCNALTMCVGAGEACGTSEDCCDGLPCVQDPDGIGGFVCYDPPGDDVCVDTGGPCTNDGDCCVGTGCQLLPGHATGTCETSDPPDGTGGTGGTGGSGGGSNTCAFYGQTCEQSSDCCNSVPCDTSVEPGVCRFTGGG